VSTPVALSDHSWKVFVTRLLTGPDSRTASRPGSVTARLHPETWEGKPAGVEVELRPESVVVQLNGELDVASAPALTALLDWVLEAHPGRIVVDVRAVTFTDCARLRPLLRAQRAASQLGSSVELHCPSRPVDLLLSALSHVPADRSKVNALLALQQDRPKN
jgi:anti-sigma B factor antagonist